MKQLEDNHPFERLDPRLLGLSTNLESQASCDSSSRSAMRASFLTQMLVVEGATPRRLTTLAEAEYGKYTSHIAVPEDCKVLKVIRKYPKSKGIYTFAKNSETTIIYESLKEHDIGIIKVPSFHFNHKVFGYQYVESPIMRRLSPGDILKEGTILADSPSVTRTKYGDDEDIEYRIGMEANVAYMSVPGIIEDGLVISKSFAERSKSRGYATKTVEWGVDRYPLNLYGNDEDYKPFPDIGERVRHDGVLYATRRYDDLLDVCNMTREALRTINHTYDDVTYLPLSSISDDDLPTVEDITVYHTHNQDLWKTPIEMAKQVVKYHNAIKQYNTDLIEIYEHEQRVRKQHLRTTRQFHQQVVRAMVGDHNVERYRLPKSTVRTHNKTKLDDWRVEIKVGWNITPRIGAKLSELHG